MLPKSALGQAVRYALNNWAALERYLEQGYLSIDNNLSERTLRAIALGRKVLGRASGRKQGSQHRTRPLLPFQAAVLFALPPLLPLSRS